MPTRPNRLATFRCGTRSAPRPHPIAACAPIFRFEKRIALGKCPFVSLEQGDVFARIDDAAAFFLRAFDKLLSLSTGLNRFSSFRRVSELPCSGVRTARRARRSATTNESEVPYENLRVWNSCASAIAADRSLSERKTRGGRDPSLRSRTTIVTAVVFKAIYSVL